MRLEFCENKLKTVFEVTDEGKLLLLHFSNADYDERVISAKREWLAKHLHSVQFDFIEIVAYGTPKSFVAKNHNDILFDDEIGNRKEWTGKAYDVHNIIKVLRSLP